ncbi:MAG: ribosome recycling factor [Planctomycetota bacterium]
MADYDEIFLEVDEKMSKAIEHLKDGYRTIRTGRATPGLVDSLHVEAYGSSVPLKQIANIAIPEPRQIVIKPFDPSTLGDIEKAIQKSELGINPSNDGKVIRLEVPQLTEERRKQLVRQVKEMGDQAKVAINNARRDANKEADAAEKAGMSEDDVKRLKEDIDELKDKYQKQVDDTFTKKSEEIMTV